MGRDKGRAIYQTNRPFVAGHKRIGEVALHVSWDRLENITRSLTRFTKAPHRIMSVHGTISGAPMAKSQLRAWQRMLSGRRLDLLDPTPVDIEIEDIAHGLAFVARWNGQTKGDFAYSVAEHSLLVTEIFRRQQPNAPVKWQLAALLHDAPEYVIGDMISPVKAAVGPGYEELDDRLTAAIHLRFGLPAQIPVAVKKQIKKADKLSAWLEAIQIAGFTQTEADKFFGKQDPALTKSLTIKLRAPVVVRDEYSKLCHTLLAKQ